MWFLASLRVQKKQFETQFLVVGWSSECAACRVFSSVISIKRVVVESLSAFQSPVIERFHCIVKYLAIFYADSCD